MNPQHRNTSCSCTSVAQQVFSKCKLTVQLLVSSSKKPNMSVRVNLKETAHVYVCVESHFSCMYVRFYLSRHSALWPEVSAGLADTAPRFRLPGRSRSSGSDAWRGFIRFVQMDLWYHRVNLLRTVLPSLSGIWVQDYSCGEITFCLKQCSPAAKIHTNKHFQTESVLWDWAHQGTSRWLEREFF